jgi:hypothetical protein
MDFLLLSLLVAAFFGARAYVRVCAALAPSTDEPSE